MYCVWARGAPALTQPTTRNITDMTVIIIIVVVCTGLLLSLLLLLLLLFSRCSMYAMNGNYYLDRGIDNIK